MKIICTVSEFGKIVRACEKGDCMNCAFVDICNKSEYDLHCIENFVPAGGVIPDDKKLDVGVRE